MEYKTRMRYLLGEKNVVLCKFTWEIWRGFNSIASHCNSLTLIHHLLVLRLSAYDTFLSSPSETIKDHEGIKNKVKKYPNRLKQRLSIGTGTGGDWTLSCETKEKLGRKINQINP